MNEAGLDAAVGGGSCWYCGKSPPAPEAARSVKMFKVTGTDLSGRSMSVLTTTVQVPRCARCHGAHTLAFALAIGAALAGALVMVILAGLLEKRVRNWMKVAMVVLGGIPGLVVWSLRIGLRPGMKSESEGVEYPGVLLMGREGWRVDDPSLKLPEAK